MRLVLPRLTPSSLSLLPARVPAFPPRPTRNTQKKICRPPPPRPTGLAHHRRRLRQVPRRQALDQRDVRLRLQRRPPRRVAHVGAGRHALSGLRARGRPAAFALWPRDKGSHPRPLDGRQRARGLARGGRGRRARRAGRRRGRRARRDRVGGAAGARGGPALARAGGGVGARGRRPGVVLAAAGARPPAPLLRVVVGQALVHPPQRQPMPALDRRAQAPAPWPVRAAAAARHARSRGGARGAIHKLDRDRDGAHGQRRAVRVVPDAVPHRQGRLAEAAVRAGAPGVRGGQGRAEAVGCAVCVRRLLCE